MPSAHQSFKYLLRQRVSRAEHVRARSTSTSAPDVASLRPGINRHARSRVGAVHRRLAAHLGLDLLVQGRQPDHADRHRRSGRVPRGHLRERGRGSRQGSGARSADAAVARRGRAHELRAAEGHRSGDRRDARQLSASDGQGARQRSALRTGSSLAVEVLGIGRRQTVERRLGSAPQLPRT